MTISSKAPCRVDLAGGTLDIWPLYLFHAHPVTVNFAVDRYASCELRERADRRIVLRSRDLQCTEEFESLEDLSARPHYNLPLAAHLVRFFAPSMGIDLTTDSEAPAGAGISGSSALMIAGGAALNRLTRRRYSIERLRAIAQNLEARVIRVPTGAQDYYPAMYGGVSAVELLESGIERQALPLDPDELNRRFVLAYTGAPRNSGINNWEVMKAHINGDRQVHANFDHIAAIARGMRDAIERSDWDAMGSLLRDEWSHRRRNSPAISTPLIDALVEQTAHHGATGAKVCGAGGGGCVFFLVQPEARERVAEIVREAGASVVDCRVAPRGVRVRES